LVLTFCRPDYVPKHQHRGLRLPTGLPDWHQLERWFQQLANYHDIYFATFSPQLQSGFRATLTQHLLQGFGFLPNKRFIIIAKNNRELTDVAFRLQITTTVDQIQNMYWDLVNAYENVKVQQDALALADKTLSDNKKQVEIGTLAQSRLCARKAR